MRIPRSCIASFFVFLVGCLLFAQDGATIYTGLCAACHDAGVERAPNREGLKAMSPERVLASMEFGAMIPMAGRLSAAERRVLAEFLTEKTLGQAIPPPQRCSAAESAAVSAIPGVAFSGSIDGHLRAYSTKNGTILWDFDRVGRYKTVDGVDARGGSLDGAGPAVANGMLFVNSGYPVFGGMSGNVLLAFLWTENSRIGPSLRD